MALEEIGYAARHSQFYINSVNSYLEQLRRLNVQHTQQIDVRNQMALQVAGVVEHLKRIQYEIHETAQQDSQTLSALNETIAHHTAQVSVR
jgi:hypothetical protein